MNSPLPKVLHRVGGRTMLDRVAGVLERAGVPDLVVVVGFGREAVAAEVQQHHPRARIAVQEEQLGTGHAVKAAMHRVPGAAKTVGVFSGDVPLLTPETVWDLARAQRERDAAAVLLTADLEDPSGYGRIVRDGEGLVERIVEEKDAHEEVLALREINAGSYLFERGALEEALGALRSDNAQGEYYLTDTVAYFRGRGRPVAAVKAPGDASEVLGVNTQEQLLEAERLLREREGDG